MISNAEDLFQTDPNNEARQRFRDLYGLRTIFANSILAPDYVPPTSLGSSIKLTPLGREEEAHTKSVLDSLTDAEYRLALFFLFGSRELFVDLAETDLDALRSTISDEVARSRIRLPFMMVRELYDRFIELNGPSTLDTLPAEETQRLLQGTSQGVFQMGRLITGPFGLLQSTVSREIRPSRSTPLSYCLDPGCQSLHGVQLQTSPTGVGRARGISYSHLFSSPGLTTDWLRVWRSMEGFERKHYDDFNMDELPWLLGNTFSEKELKQLLTAVLSDYPDIIRPHLPTGRDYRHLRGSATEIASTLTHAQCCQVALILSDEQIIVALERLIDAKRIVVPATEVRISPVSPRRIGGWRRQRVECSSLGVRSVSFNFGLAIPRLKALLKKLHGTSDDLDDLEWQLLEVPGTDLFSKLDRFVHETELRSVIRDLVISRPKLFEDMKLYLRYGNFTVPDSHETKEALISKVLWKLGFDVPIYPDANLRFWHHFDLLKTVLASNDLSSEARQEEVRAVAVNFFVALEEVLDRALSFSVWALVSDHFDVSKPQRFKLNLVQARRVMYDQLNGSPLGRDEVLRMDPSGQNNLFALVEGFRVAADKLMKVRSENEASARRDASGFPGYYPQATVELFPLIHTVAILDIQETAAQSIIALLREVGQGLLRGNVKDIRNRIPHTGGEFPSRAEFETALLAIEQSVLSLEDAGASPLVSLPIRRTTDSFGRASRELVDYRGRKTTLYQPSELTSANIPPPHRPQVIFREARLRGSSEVLRFRFEEESDFVQMWRGYPRRVEGSKPTPQSNEGEVEGAQDGEPEQVVDEAPPS